MGHVPDTNNDDDLHIEINYENHHCEDFTMKLTARRCSSSLLLASDVHVGAN